MYVYIRIETMEKAWRLSHLQDSGFRATWHDPLINLRGLGLIYLGFDGLVVHKRSCRMFSILYRHLQPTRELLLGLGFHIL